jgi:hypothetical protein
VTAQREKALDIARKLLAKAESAACTEEERAAFLAKAQELMLAHAIEEAELDLSRPAHERAKPSVHTVPLKKRDEVRQAKANLMAVVCKHNRCRTLLGEDSLWVIGYESDVAFCEMLWTSLLVQLAAERGPAWSAYNGPFSRFKWVTGFAHGFVRGVADKLEAIHRAATREPGAELVLARQTAVDELYEQLADPGSKARARSVTREAFLAGRDAGQRADVGQARAGRGTKGEIK